jgi:hypothetical protein
VNDTTNAGTQRRRSDLVVQRGGLTDKGCWSCMHCDGAEEGCMQPDLYDLDNEANEVEGTSAETGEAIRAWRDNASGFDALAVVDHDEPCPGWEAE